MKLTNEIPSRCEFEIQIKEHFDSASMTNEGGKRNVANYKFIK